MLYLLWITIKVASIALLVAGLPAIMHVFEWLL